MIRQEMKDAFTRDMRDAFGVDFDRYMKWREVRALEVIAEYFVMLGNPPIVANPLDRSLEKWRASKACEVK